MALNSAPKIEDVAAAFTGQEGALLGKASESAFAALKNVSKSIKETGDTISYQNTDKTDSQKGSLVAYNKLVKKANGPDASSDSVTELANRFKRIRNAANNSGEFSELENSNNSKTT